MSRASRAAPFPSTTLRRGGTNGLPAAARMEGPAAPTDPPSDSAQASGAKRLARMVRLSAALGMVLVSVALGPSLESEPPDPAPSRALAAKGTKWNFLAARRNFAATLHQAESIPDGAAKAGILLEIANAQAEAGDVAGAKATAATIEDPRLKLRALRAIAKAQAWAEGNLPAEEWAKTLPEPQDRCAAHLGVAEAARAMAEGRKRPDEEMEEERPFSTWPEDICYG